MIDLTADQIELAKAGDTAAIDAMFRASDGRIVQLATRAATSGGRTDHGLAEDLAQDGRESLWKGLARFSGSTPAQFFAFLNATVNGVLIDRSKAATRQGVSVAVAKRFARSLAVDRDPAAAETRCVAATEESGLRLSPELARAARQAWERVERLDAPERDSEETGADRLTYTSERDRISDEEREAREVTRGRVHETLAALRASDEALLSLAFGIGDFPQIGAGDLRGLSAADYREISDVAGVAAVAVDGRYAGAKAAFRASYLGGSPAPEPEGTAKRCRDCERTLPLSDFHVMNKRTGSRRPECKECKKAAHRRYKRGLRRGATGVSA